MATRKKFLTKEVLQIILAVIGVIGTITVAYFQFAWKPPDEPKNDSTVIQYSGRILDATTQKPIANAKITFDLPGLTPQIAYTDTEGIYLFNLELLENQSSGRVRVDADGYEIYNRNIVLSVDIPKLEDIRLSPVQIMPTPTISIGSAPVIDSIGVPSSIECDKRNYDVPIYFHDADGDAHRIQWELRYSKKQTTLYTDAKEFYIDSEVQKTGALYTDFISWYVPGDEVTIRVYITDRKNLTGYKDFEFKCSK